MLDLDDRLAELEELGLYRRTRMVSGPQGPRVVLDGEPVLVLCSANALGLADHPRVRQAAADAAMRWGVGAAAEAGLESEVDVITGSLGKALGSYGGYACCDHVTARYLLNAARPLLHSTAPAPVAVAAALAALELLEEQPRRVEKLQANAAVLRDELAREGFEVSGACTHVVPVLIGRPELALRIVDAALDDGVFAEAVVPPLVPDGAARLRVAAMASHSRSELRDAARVLGRAALRCGFRPGAGSPVATAPGGVFDAAAELP